VPNVTGIHDIRAQTAVELAPLLATEVTIAFPVAAVDVVEDVAFRAVELKAADPTDFKDWPSTELADVVAFWKIHSLRDSKGL
jgi:hypothetical protein